MHTYVFISDLKDEPLQRNQQFSNIISNTASISRLRKSQFLEVEKYKTQQNISDLAAWSATR